MGSTIRAIGTRVRLASKPVETTVVIMGHEVRCPCGDTWIATEKLSADPGNVCDRCHRAPIAGRFGPLEPHRVTVPIQLHGGVRSVALL